MEEQAVRRDFMDAAWAAFIYWAVKHAQFADEYEADTGKLWRWPKSRLESLVDKATGYAPDIEDFVLWATEVHWGVDEAPFRIRQRIKERRQGRA